MMTNMNNCVGCIYLQEHRVHEVLVLLGPPRVVYGPQLRLGGDGGAGRHHMAQR